MISALNTIVVVCVVTAIIAGGISLAAFAWDAALRREDARRREHDQFDGPEDGDE